MDKQNFSGPPWESKEENPSEKPVRRKLYPPGIVKRIPSFRPQDVEHLRRLRQEVEELLGEEPESPSWRLGIRLAMQLPFEEQKELLRQKGKIDWDWSWIFEVLEEQWGLEEVEELCKELEAEKPFLQGLWEKHFLFRTPFRVAAQSEEEVEILPWVVRGQVRLTDPEGKVWEKTYYSREDRAGEIFLPLDEKEKKRVIFEGQKDPSRPYEIPPSGWFQPREEDQGLFEGEVRGKILPGG